jgi:CubicO group peptidase (beta-lactamase class C family)
MRRNRTGTTWAAALVAIVAAGAAFAQVAPDPLDGLDAYVEETMKLWDVPGAAVVVVKDDTVVFAKGFGVRHVADGGKVDADTLFAIGSNTKAFTATAIGLLVQEGRLSWDDPVLRYLPDFQMYDPLVTRKITIRDLLCHRGGLATFQGDLASFNSIYDRAEIIRRIRFIEPGYDFRAGFGYSNSMFLVAGEIIPRVTGTSWDDFIEQRFFEPLGMSRSNTSLAGLASAANVATPHGFDHGKVVPIANDSVDNMAPAGSINSSANDMAQWLLLQTGNGSHGGRQLVDPAVISETRKPHNLLQVDERSKKLNPSTHFSAYGLGWGLSDYEGRLVVSHGGGLDGMISHVALLPEEKLGVAVMTNFDSHALHRAVVNHVIDAYLGVPDRELEKSYAPLVEQVRGRQEHERAAREEARVQGTSPSRPAEDYVGKYTSAVYGDAEITLEDGALTIHPKGHPRISGRLEHWQLDTFLCTWTDRVWDQSLVFFDLDDQAKVKKFRFTVRPEWIDTLEYVFVKQPQ